MIGWCNCSYLISLVNNCSGKNTVLLPNLTHPSNSFSINLSSQTLPQDQKGKRLWLQTYVSELDHSELSQLAHAAVGRLRLQKELGQGHLFTSEQLPHGGGQTPTQLEKEICPPMTETHKAEIDTQSRKRVVYTHQSQVRLCGYERNPEQSA